MIYKNLTPHSIRLVRADGTVQDLPAQPVSARCSEMTVAVNTLDGVEFIDRFYGTVIGLPDPEPGVVYVVSMMVRQAVPERGDVVSPGDLIRDAAGNIVGCKNLVINRPCCNASNN